MTPMALSKTDLHQFHIEEGRMAHISCTYLQFSGTYCQHRSCSVEWSDNLRIGADVKKISCGLFF